MWCLSPASIEKMSLARRHFTRRLGVIDWVHELAKGWGAYRRSQGSGYRSINILHKMMREGTGASHGYYYVPLDDIDRAEPKVLTFHRAFQRLPALNQDVIYVLYVPLAKMPEKIKVLQDIHNLRKSRIYELRSQSHAQIWGYIDAHIQTLSVKNTFFRSEPMVNSPIVITDCEAQDA